MKVNAIIGAIVGSVVLVSASAYLLSGNGNITLKKEHKASAPEWLEKNSNKVTRELYEINQSVVPKLTDYITETNELFRLKRLDFNAIATLKPEKLSLAYSGEEAISVKTQYVKLISAVKQIVDDKIAEKHQAIRDAEDISNNYEIELATLSLKQQGYREKVQTVYDLKDQAIAKQEASEQAVKAYSLQLSSVLNQHPSFTKTLKDKYFERPKMREGVCKETIVSEYRTLEVAYTVQNFCFSSKINVAKNTADNLAKDTKTMSEIEITLRAIALEKIEQGETYNKAGGKSGYKQQIRSFSRGGIEAVKKSAKAEYGNTDSGFSYKIKSVNEKLTANNRKIAHQKEAASIIPSKQIKHSIELKALKPLSEKLDTLILQYLNASFVNAIGEPAQKSTEDYSLIQLDESEDIYLVKDSYVTDTETEVEFYLVNTQVLLESPAIQKHFDGKEIPVSAAANVDGLILWRGGEVNYPRIGVRLTELLTAK